MIRESGYEGPFGILGHTMDDAEERLKDNLDGLDWLVPQLDGKAPGPRPKPRTPVPPAPRKAAAVAPEPDDAAVVAALIREAREQGDGLRAPRSSPRPVPPACPATRSATRGARSAPR